jgi:hypothetical protein
MACPKGKNREIMLAHKLAHILVEGGKGSDGIDEIPRQDVIGIGLSFECNRRLD